MIRIISHNLELKQFKVIETNTKLWKVGEIITLSQYLTMKRNGVDIAIVKVLF